MSLITCFSTSIKGHLRCLPRNKALEFLNLFSRVVSPWALCWPKPRRMRGQSSPWRLWRSRNANQPHHLFLWGQTKRSPESKTKGKDGLLVWKLGQWFQWHEAKERKVELCINNSKTVTGSNPPLSWMIKLSNQTTTQLISSLKHYFQHLNDLT